MTLGELQKILSTRAGDSASIEIFAKDVNGQIYTIDAVEVRESEDSIEVCIVTGSEVE